MTVTPQHVREALVQLGLEGQDVEVHSSLRAFGHLAGGPLGVIEPLLDVCSTVLMPAFHSLGRCNPPPDDRPDLNGWDYDSHPVDETDLVPFDPAAFGVDSPITVQEMGIIPATLLKQPGACRSVHPSVSWVAKGPDAPFYTHDHPADDPNIIMRRLYERRGYALLLGVTLTRCTSVHLAEELAGARTLIRWSRGADGAVRRFRESGCSGGFDNLAPHVAEHLRSARIGPCQVRCYPLAEMVPAAVEALKANPQLVICGRQGTCRCKDVAAGGPRDVRC